MMEEIATEAMEKLLWGELHGRFEGDLISDQSLCSPVSTKMAMLTSMRTSFSRETRTGWTRRGPCGCTAVSDPARWSLGILAFPCSPLLPSPSGRP